MTTHDPRGRGRVAATTCLLHINAVVAAALLFAPPEVAHAQATPLTERAAVQMALARPAYRAAEASRIAIGESTVAQAGLPPNPHLSLAHERVNAPGGRAIESTLQLSQEFDVSGRRILRRQAAEHRLDSIQAEGEAARRRLVGEVRNAFSDALHRDQARRALRAWGQRIDVAYTIVRELAKAGEASGYERRRLERERQTAQARAARTEADYLRAREVLLGLLGPQQARVVDPAGDLIPDELPPLTTAQASLRRRPDLQALLAQAEAFDRERRAAERAWIPDVTLGAGPKRVEEAGRNDIGLALSVSIPLPIFDRGQPAQQRATAEAALTRAEHDLRLDRWEAELRGVWAQASELRRTAVAFRNEAISGSRDLSRIAEAAYRGGESTLLELLDAYRNELEAETTTLELELAARLARIELDLLSGAPVYE